MTQDRAALVSFVFGNSLLLLVGTLAAVIWANVDAATYDSIAHPLHFWINDVGMVFFFALAAKEVFEATLPGGALASGRQAMSPLAAAVGGMAAPAAIYAALATTLGPSDLLGLVILALFYPSDALSFTALDGIDECRARIRTVAAATTYAEFLVVYPRPRRALVGGFVLGRLSPSAGAGPYRALHAPWLTRPRPVRTARKIAA